MMIPFLVMAQASSKLPFLSPVFADHMVLQRDIPVAVYGKAAPGEKVTVAFAGQTQAASADKEGAWCVKLAAMKAKLAAAPRLSPAKASLADPARARAEKTP